MSAKYTIFPPGPGKSGKRPAADDDDGLYTGQPVQHGEADPEEPREPEPAVRPRGAAKGRAAYAAQEGELPPHAPQGAACTGGLFAGMPEQPAEPEGFSADTGESPLSLVSDEQLQEECRKRVCPSCPVREEAEDIRLRALAELENAKKRLAREYEQQTRFAAESVLNDILPSLDNLDLALKHAGSNEGCKDFVVGVRMTRKLLQEALARHGLAQVGAEGEEFNPTVHEAVDMVDAPDMADNHIRSLLSNGYTLNGRLLRPARVIVSRKG